MLDSIEYRWSPSPRLYRITRTLLGPLVAKYFHTTCIGAQHIPKAGGVVLACNHLSNLDPVLLAAVCPRQINYLAKIELFRIPLLGRLIRHYGAIPLRRTASDPEAVRLAEFVLEQDHLLALFPEGTRSRDGQLKPFRFGAARLTLKYNVPLIPAAIIGTEKAMPSGKKVPQRVPVGIAFGAPIATEPYQYSRTGGVPEAASLESVTLLLQTAVGQLKQQLEATINRSDAGNMQH